MEFKKGDRVEVVRVNVGDSFHSRSHLFEKKRGTITFVYQKFGDVFSGWIKLDKSPISINDICFANITIRKLGITNPNSSIVLGEE